MVHFVYPRTKMLTNILANMPKFYKRKTIIESNNYLNV